MKAFTDISQSKKLAEILPIESADMCYIATADDDKGDYLYTAEYKSEFIFREDDEDCISCWSLAALLNVIPSGKALIHDKGNLGYKCICNNMDTYFHDNPLDACYEMIIKLNELNLL